MINNISQESRQSETSSQVILPQGDGIAEGGSGQDVTKKYGGNAMYIPLGRRHKPAATALAPAPEEKTTSLLRYRVDKLCFQCHRGMDPASPENKEKWVHGPFQAGVCLACHAPHESSYPKLLTVYPLEKLCAQCHAEFHSKKGAAAYPSRPCADCHSPHYQDKAPGIE